LRRQLPHETPALWGHSLTTGALLLLSCNSLDARVLLFSSVELLIDCIPSLPQ
jgi:hypothetical protein